MSVGGESGLSEGFLTSRRASWPDQADIAKLRPGVYHAVVPEIKSPTRMSASSDSPTHPVYSVLGDRYAFLITGAETGGAYAIFDAMVPPGAGSPPHVHHREDEAFYVLEGEFEFHVAGESVRVGAGGFLFGKRDVPHNFKNIGGTPGRMIFIVTPAGLENFFREIGTRLASRNDPPSPPTPDQVARLMELAPTYGLEIFAPH